MGIFYPFSFAFKTFNTAGNLYLAGQIGYWVFREIRTMQKEKIQADKLREQFVKNYREKFKEDPSEEMISMALQSYDAVERPVLHRMNQTKDKAVEAVRATKGQVQEAVREFFTSWTK